ncbi:hypothetical protein BH11BAC1_BH11BAC1_10980 [soil metagenome]
MKNMSTFNKIFLLFCAALFLMLVLKAPHENEKNGIQKQEIVNADE